MEKHTNRYNLVNFINIVLKLGVVVVESHLQDILEDLLNKRDCCLILGRYILERTVTVSLLVLQTRS